MEEFKILVTEVLTQHASAILLDPGVGHSREQAPREGLGPADGVREDRLRRRDAGTAARSARPVVGRAASRTSAPTASRSCSTTRRPTPQKINEHKHAWVERIGDECRANDIPFFLEVIAYEEGLDEKGLEFAKKKPELVTAYMREIHQGPVWRRRSEGRSARST
jgi:tagatose 1,6-diphosphate aldolase